jgi:plasmid stabilization system protein ParE
MELKWTREASSDLDRLHRFLAGANPRAAQQVVVNLVRAPVRLLDHPRLGNRLEEFENREVRRILVGQYEIRYEVTVEAIYVLRIWHGREDR